jgi:hypothetical protein
MQRSLVVTCVTLLALGCAARSAAPSNTPSPPPESAPPPTQPDQTGEAQREVGILAPLVGYWAMLGTTSGAPAMDVTGWQPHAASGTCFPTGLGSFSLVNRRTYAPDDESVSLLNRDLGTLITLYTYPARGTAQQDFEQSFGEMGGTCGPGQAISTVAGGEYLGACTHTMPPGVAVIEQVWLVHRGRWSHKARFTFVAQALGQAWGPAMTVLRTAFAPCPMQ